MGNHLTPAFSPSPLETDSLSTSPSPAPKPRPASCTGPTGPTLRANPFPEVTDLICRLPLPTLVYRPEASYLGDLMRIWVRTCPKIGASRALGRHASPLFSRLPPKRFSRTGRGTRDAARTAALFSQPCNQRPFSRGVVFRATALQLEKKTLSRTSADGRWLVPVSRVLLSSTSRRRPAGGPSRHGYGI